MFCTRFKQGERVFLLSVSRCGISRRQVHLRGVTRWESGILNYELVFGECFRFIIGEIPAWPRKNGNYGKKLLPTHIHAFSFPSPFSFLLVGGALARERPRRLKQRLHERCFIWNRIVFDAVTPSVYTTPIETVAETGSIWKRCQKWSVFKTIRIYLTCKQRNRIDLSTVTIIVRNLHSSIQNGESRMCHHITSYLLFFSEAIQNITIFNISSGSIPNQHPKTFYWLWIH